MRKRRGRTARGKRMPEVEINVYKRKGADLFNQLYFSNEKLQAN
ncbi:hypothetical protein [Peribacillus frigoritolerans]|nr:hypothetical protein [Peribacillus frigoritolerans]UZD46162.1 hypothetical protein OMJ04_21615 [Peribacillus frigoritolerans]